MEIINADKPIAEFLSAENLKSWQVVKDSYKNILLGLYRLETANKLNNKNYINNVISSLEILMNFTETEFEENEQIYIKKAMKIMSLTMKQ